VVGLGSKPGRTLAEARARALDNARAVAAGKDPRTGDAPTVAEAWEQVIRLRRPTWRDGGKSEDQWRASFRDYVEPQLGSKLVSEVTTADVLAVLLPHWHERAETMRRVKQRLGAVLGWALAQGHRDDNPARSEALTAALPKQPAGGHQRALAPEDVPAAVAAIQSGTASPVVKLAVEFVVLTGCRSGEARNASWDEIDGGTWTISGERTKTGRPHRIPLSPRALAVLDEARGLGNGSDLIFGAPAPASRCQTTLSARPCAPLKFLRLCTDSGPASETGSQPRVCPTNWPKPCWPTSPEASPSPTGVTTYSKHGAPSWNTGHNSSRAEHE